MSVTRVQLIGNVSAGATFVGIVTATSFVGDLTGTATNAGLSTNVKGTGSRVLYNSSTDTTTTSGNLTFDGTTLALNSTPGANTSALSLTGVPFGSNTKNGILGIGTLGFTDSNLIANFTDNVNSYAQVILQNLNSGNAASADFIVNSDSPLGQTYYGDFGINGTAYNGGGPFGDTSGTYLYAKGGTLAVGTDDAQDFRIATGSGPATPVTRVTVTGVGGSVGIGTTNPTSKFHVVGDGRFTGIITATKFSGDGSELSSIPNSATTATSSNTASAIVARDASGGFNAGIVTTTSINDSAGNLRDIPQNAQTSAYILVASDAGKHISITTGGVTVNASVFNVGQAVTIYNNSGSNQTITQGASVTLRQSGTANTGNRTLAQYGVATILCVTGGATPTFVISGSGLS